MDNNCFAFNPTRKKCMALTYRRCSGPDCPFRKSNAEVDASRLKADRRLAGLPEASQQHIAETYYDGKRPWLITARKAVGK
jgi:hypothetical protein